MSDYIDLSEFISEGYLQEANRTFFHPLGLALEVETSTGKVRIRDERDDPLGVRFGEGVVEEEKIKKVDDKWGKKMGKRVEELGYMVQSAEDSPYPEEEQS